MPNYEEFKTFHKPSEEDLFYRIKASIIIFGEEYTWKYIENINNSILRVGHRRLFFKAKEEII